MNQVLTSRIVIGLCLALSSASAVVSGCSDSEGTPGGNAGSSNAGSPNAGSPAAGGEVNGGPSGGSGAVPSEGGAKTSNEGGAMVSNEGGASGVGIGGAVNEGGADQGSGGGSGGDGLGANGGAGDAGGAAGASGEMGGAGENSAGGAGGGGNALQCAVGAGSDGLIDDFGDNDLSSHAGDGRKSAVWQAYNDAVISLHSAGGYMSCEVTSIQQACGVTLHQDCYDASKYSGIKLVARGKGKFVFALKTPITTPISEGGRCDVEADPLICGNHFKFWLTDLSEEFSTLIVPWSKFEQGDWGQPEPSEFRKDELMSVIFGADIVPESGDEATLEIDKIELY